MVVVKLLNQRGHSLVTLIQRIKVYSVCFVIFPKVAVCCLLPCGSERTGCLRAAEKQESTLQLLIAAFVISNVWFTVFLFIACRESCSYNLKARVKGAFFGLLGLLLPFVLFVNFLASSSARGTLDGLVGKEKAEKLHIYTVRLHSQCSSSHYKLLVSFYSRCF